MQSQRRELYRERTEWALWVHLLLWGAFGGSAVTILYGLGDATEWSLPLRLTAALGLMAVGGLIYLLFGGTTVVVDREGIQPGLGWGWPLRTRISFQDVQSMESVTYSPMREFGGWGLRGSGKKRAWTSRGNQAVVLHLKDGRQVYIGSDEPTKLEGRIRNAMQLGGHGGGVHEE